MKSRVAVHRSNRKLGAVKKNLRLMKIFLNVLLYRLKASDFDGLSLPKISFYQLLIGNKTANS